MLQHKKVSIAARDGVFNNVNSMEDLRNEIRRCSIDNVALNVPPASYDPEDDEPFDYHSDRKTYRGDMFEIFVEFLLQAMANDKEIGVQDAAPVPLDEDLGVDLLGKSTKDYTIVAVQCKFKSNPNHVFSYRELATFMSTASNLHDAKGRNQLLITTAVDTDARPVLRYTIKSVNPDMRVLDWTRLKYKVDNNLGFWDGLRKAIEESKLKPVARTARTLYDYQNDAVDTIKGWLA